MQVTKMLNSAILLSVMGEGVGARKEDRAARENRTESVTLETKTKVFFGDEPVAVEEKDRAERSLIGASVNVQYRVYSINVQYQYQSIQYQYKYENQNKYPRVQYQYQVFSIKFLQWLMALSKDFTSTS